MSLYIVLTNIVINNGLKTTNDLFKLIDDLASLSQKEREDYEIQISDILCKIPNYMLNASIKQRDQYKYALQSSYRSEFFILINNIIYKIDHNEPYLPKKQNVTSFPFTSESKPVLKLKPQVKDITLADIEKEIQNTKEQQKKLEPILLEWHKETQLTSQDYEANYKAVPEMINAIRDLILNIRKNVMNSQITEFILLFEDINKVILSEHPDQMTIYTLINDCLKNNGWSESGFYSPPDKAQLTKIAKELHQILDMVA